MCAIFVLMGRALIISAAGYVYILLNVGICCLLLIWLEGNVMIHWFGDAGSIYILLRNFFNRCRGDEKKSRYICYGEAALPG